MKLIDIRRLALAAGALSIACLATVAIAVAAPPVELPSVAEVRAGCARAGDVYAALQPLLGSSAALYLLTHLRALAPPQAMAALGVAGRVIDALLGNYGSAKNAV
jgi:hypothetical protein